ncbi:hypothetical protein Vadar_023827 [Vaccinium darrowii]|uniref:Uncharacterized protein n=1 Tax=Vaccinium darrowii TaxID=229202 RepID=A0ACB7ZMG2_9ERIC|nr:hypothetical protein Vadar_023827 [Vaccinium darrowii]
MSVFSQQHQPFLLDSSFFTPIKIMSGFSEEPNTPLFSQLYPPESVHQIPVHEFSSCLENSTRFDVSINGDDSSSVVDNKAESGEQVTQKLIPMDKKRKNRDGSAQSKDAREVKGKNQMKCNGVMKGNEEKKTKENKKDQKKKVNEEAPTGFIHVRARRGQATDSHSLAERVRREKISERMKLLQALVPGCDKVTGKALMLDEIINYVQSLQNQVEFLSMKLASVNPMFYDFGMDLDAFMVPPEIRLNGLVSPLLMPNLQKCNHHQATAFSDASAAAATAATSTTLTIPNSYALVDTPTSTSLLLQQVQRPNILSQDTEQLLFPARISARKFQSSKK